MNIVFQSYFKLLVRTKHLGTLAGWTRRFGSLTCWFVWQAAWTVNSMPVRNTERMIFNSIHNVEMPSKMSYPLFMFISSPCHNRRINHELFLARIAEIMLGNYSPCQTDRNWSYFYFQTFSQPILPFASTMKKRFTRKLTVACHRHPTEWWETLSYLTMNGFLTSGRLVHRFPAVSRCTAWSRVIPKSSCCSARELVSFARPRGWVLTYGTWRVLLQSENVFESEGISKSPDA